MKEPKVNIQIYTLGLGEKLTVKLRQTHPNIIPIKEISSLNLQNKKNCKKYFLFKHESKIAAYDTLLFLKKSLGGYFESIILIDHLNFSHKEAKGVFSMGADFIIPSSIGEVSIINSIMRFIAKDLIKSTATLNQKERHQRAVNSIIKASSPDFDKVEISQAEKLDFVFSGHINSLLSKNKLLKLINKIPIIKKANTEHIRIIPPFISKKHLKEKISATLDKYSNDIKSIFVKVLNQRLLISGKIVSSKKLDSLNKDLQNIEELKSIRSTIKYLEQ